MDSLIRHHSPTSPRCSHLWVGALVLSLAALSLSCTEDTGTADPYGIMVGDRQIATFSSNLGVGVSDTAYAVLPVGRLVNFSKTVYVGVDSITFAVVARSSAPTAFLTAQVYNVTDSQLVPFSQVTTGSTAFTLVQSGNVFLSLPSKSLTLAVAIKSSSQGILVELQQAHLFLYR